MGRGKAQVKPKGGGSGHGVKKAKKVLQEVSKIKSKRSVVAMLLKAKAKPDATLLTQGHLEVGDPVEVKEAGVVHECRVVSMADDLVQVHYLGWNSRYDTWVRYPGSSRQALRDRTNKALEDLVPNLAVRPKIKGGLKVQEAPEKSAVMEDVQIKEEEDEVAKQEEKIVKTNPSLCEYELIRLENIRQREALFAQLDLDAAKVEASPRIERTVSAPSRRGLQTAKREKEVLPRRASTRLAGGAVKEIERYNPVPEPEVRRTPEIECKTLALAEVTDSDASSLLASLATNEKGSSDSTEFSKLTINPERVAKVVPERIFSVAFHPGEKLVVAAGDKWGKVGMWDCQDTEGATHGVHLFRYHSRPVNCITWDTHSPSLFSTSYDGTVRCLDVERQEASLMFYDENFLEEGGWTSFHCQDSAHTLLVSLGNEGKVAQVDRRVGTSAVSTFNLFDRLHAKSVSCNPLKPHLLLTGTNKGGCFIYDLRSSRKSSGLLTPLVELQGATRSLSSCQFSPSGSQVVTISTDDKFRLYNTENITGSALQPAAQVRHNNQTGRWLTPFRATWHPTRENAFLTGSMERPRRMEVWSSAENKLSMVAKLSGDEMASVASLVDIHHSGAVVGANSSGRLHLFA